MTMSFRVGCRRFLEGPHGDRAHTQYRAMTTGSYTTLRGTTGSVLCSARYRLGQGRVGGRAPPPRSARSRLTS